MNNIQLYLKAKEFYEKYCVHCARICARIPDRMEDRSFRVEDKYVYYDGVDIRIKVLEEGLCPIFLPIRGRDE